MKDNADNHLNEVTAKGFEMNLNLLKYLAAACWGPIIIFSALSFQLDGRIYAKLLLTISLALLFVAGSIFSLAFIKQTLAYNLLHLPKEYLSTIEQTQPNVAATFSVATRLGHIADKFAYPFMTTGYLFAALFGLSCLWA